MAYFVDLSEGPVTSFLEDQERVSPAMREALENSLELHLGENGDHYCLTEGYRIHGTSQIEFVLVIADPETEQPRAFRVRASDASAPSGVLKVLYLDELTI